MEKLNKLDCIFQFIYLIFVVSTHMQLADSGMHAECAHKCFALLLIIDRDLDILRLIL